MEKLDRIPDPLNPEGLSPEELQELEMISAQIEVERKKLDAQNPAVPNPDAEEFLHPHDPHGVGEEMK